IDVDVPAITTCVEDQSFCQTVSGTYTIPTLTDMTDPCDSDLSVSFDITGDTERSGTGNDASGTFNVGTSYIVWTIDNGCRTATCTTTVTVTAAVAHNLGKDTYYCSIQGAIDDAAVG